jgi:hypothetical protein
MRDQGPFGYLPWGVRHVAGFFIKRYCWAMLYFQGTGRHSPNEVRQFLEESIGAMEDYAQAARAKLDVTSKAPFWILGGEKPTEVDFVLFGYVVNLLQITAT